MSRHSWAYRAGLPANVRACSLPGCPWLCRTDGAGRGSYKLPCEGAWQAAVPLCEGTSPAKPQRVHPSRAAGRGGERRRAGEL